MNLDETAVSHLLSMDEAIPAMERALADFSSGKVVQPVRTIVPVAEHQGFLGVMPAYTGAALGTKLVTFYPHNTDMHTHHATILLFKPETGEPLVTMDGSSPRCARRRSRRWPRNASPGLTHRCWRSSARGCRRAAT